MQKEKKVDFGNLDDGNIKQHDDFSKNTQSFTYQMRGLDKNTNKEKMLKIRILKLVKIIPVVLAKRRTKCI
jgi:hypothetical protein